MLPAITLALVLMAGILAAAGETRHFLRTYHNHKNRNPPSDCKPLILKTERCWSGRSGTLGKRV
jgi:hypothetical protein